MFGVAAAATLVMHRQGVRFWDTGFGPLIVINLVLDLLHDRTCRSPRTSAASIGGLLATEAMMQARKAEQPALGYVGAAFVGVASFLLALAVAGADVGSLFRGDELDRAGVVVFDETEAALLRELGAPFPRSGREDLVARPRA